MTAASCTQAHLCTKQHIAAHGLNLTAGAFPFLKSSQAYGLQARVGMNTCVGAPLTYAGFGESQLPLTNISC